MMEEYPDVLTVEEACEVLRISSSTLYHLLSLGEIKGYRIGKTWRVPKLAIQEFIISCSKINR